MYAVGHHGRLRTHEAPLHQVLQNNAGVLFGRLRHCLEPDLWVLRGFVRVINPRELFDLAPARLSVHALRVTRFTHLQRRIHEHLYKVLGPHQGAHILARRLVRTHCRTDDHAAMPDELRRHKPDAPDINVPVIFAKPQALREMRAHYIAIEHRDLPAMLQQEYGEHLGRGGLARAAQPREPDAHALPMAGRIGLGQNLRHLRPRKPARQLLALVQVLVADLRARNGRGAGARGNPRHLLVARPRPGGRATPGRAPW